MTLRFRVLFGLLFVYFHDIPCQAQSPDSVLYLHSLTSLRQVYLQGIGDNAQIYHGTEFIRNGVKTTGSQFFESDNLLNGSVSYQGTVYTNRSMQYDLVSDELITNNFQQTAFINLSSEKVDSFTIDGHKFVKLEAGKNNGLTKTGFYEKLLSGNPGVYVNRYKKFVAATGSIEPKYTEYDEYLINIGQNYYPVDSKSALLELFRDQKDELKKYIRANKLKFNKNLESSLVLATIYYSRLKH